MAGINGKDFINTFIKGMDLDTNITLVSNDSYTYGENVRVTVDDSSNTGTLHAIEGLTNLTVDTVKYKYYEYDLLNDIVNEKYADFDPDKIEVIGVGVIRDYVCLLARDKSDQSFNYIFRLRIINDEPILTLIVSGEFNIGGPDRNQISITTKWEDFDNIKIYWADGYNSLRSINIAETNDLNNYNKSTNFFDSTISIGTAKPIFDSFIAGNLQSGMVQYAYQMFDVNGAETKISALSDLIHLTKSNAFDVNYQGSEPTLNTGKSCKIKFEITDPKFSTCKMYRLLYTSANELPKVYVAAEFRVTPRTEDGKSMQYFSDTGSVLTEITYDEFISSNPYFFIPKVLESKDGRLFAANVIEDTWILNNGKYDYDTRAFRFAQNSENGVHAKLLSITGDDKIIKYDDLINMTDEQWYAFLPADHDCINPLNSNFADNLKRDKSSYEWYNDNTTLQYKGGNGRNVSYKIVHTRFGEDFYDTNSDTRPNYRSKKINDYNGHTRDVTLKNQGKYEDVGLPMNYNIPDTDSSTYEQADYYTNEPTVFNTLGPANYSNPYLDAKYRSYQRDDIYRFGVVFYNKKGQNTPVSWIGDIRMPSMSEYEHRLFDQWERIKVSRDSSNTNVYQVVTYPMGLQFSFKNLPDEVYQIEVVRCERTRDDRRVIAQGLISRTATTNSVTRPLLVMNYNNGFSQRTIDKIGPDNESDLIVSPGYTIDMTSYMNNDTSIYTFISPEISYFGDSTTDFTSRIGSYEILYGMSSPTWVSDPWSGAVNDDNNWIANANRVRNSLVHTYNSQIWFNREINWPSHGDDDDVDLYFMDGSTGRRDQNLRTLYNRSILGFTKDGEYTEDHTKLVAKMYHPFTFYSGDPSNFDINSNRKIYNIENISYAQGLNYDQYEEVTGGLHKVVVGNRGYQNWVIDKTLTEGYPKQGSFSPCFVYKSDDFFDSVPRINVIGASNDNGRVVYSKYFNHDSFNVYPQTDSSTNYNVPDQYSKALCYSLNATFLVNMYQNVLAYGGQDFNNRANSTYISTQSLINVEEFPNPTFTVFSGDTYLGISEQIQQHWYYLASDPIPVGPEEIWEKVGQKAQIVLYYPCESSINLSMPHGTLWHTFSNIATGNDAIGGNSGFYPYDIELQAGTHVPNGFTQEKDLYLYNSVYSTNSLSATFLPKGTYTEDNKNFDYRVLYSEMKTNDEISDSWLKFRVANYLDVDTRFGSINNLKLFNNYLYYWQDNSFGVLSVNSRSLIQDNNIGQLVLGSGDVLTRYDHISTSNGSKKDVLNNVVITPSTMFWYDHSRGELLSFSDQLSPISKMKNVQSFFNKNKDNITDDVDTLYNKKYNEVSFMFNMKDGSYNHLVYNEQVNGFTSFYTFNPDWFIDLKDNYYTLKDNNIHKMNSGSYNKFYTDDIYDTKIQIVINENPTITKVFDNVETTGNIELNEFFKYNTTTRTQTSEDITEDDVKLREDSYRFYVPRSTDTITTDSELFPNYKDRMRGKYMFANFNFKPLNNDLEIPYIKTSYRISNI